MGTNFTTIFGGQPESNDLVQPAPSRNPEEDGANEDGDVGVQSFRTVGNDDDGQTGPLGPPSGEPEPYDG